MTTKLPEDSSSVTYRAVYKGVEPAVSFGAYTTPASGTDVKDADNKKPSYTLKASFTDTADKANTKYTVALTNEDGVQLGDVITVDKIKSSPDTFGDVSVFFCGNPDTSKHAQVNAADFLKSGKYTVTVKEGETVVATKTLEVVKVTYKSADGKTTVATKYYQQTENGTALEANYNDAAGYAVSTTKGLSGDVTLYAAAQQYVGTVTYGENTAKGNSGDVTIPVTDVKAAAGDKYAVSVKNPAGAEVYKAAVEATDVTGSVTIPNVEFTFDQNSATKRSASETEKAGAYTIEITKTPKDENAEATSSKAKMTLTELVYTAGEGEFKGAAAKAAKSFFTDAASSFAFTGITISEATVKAPAGKALDGTAWQIGDKAASDDTVKVGETNTLAPKFKAEAAKIAAPVVTFTKELKPNSTKEYQYKVTATCATPGAEIQVASGANEGAATSFAKFDGQAIDATAVQNVYKFKAVYVDGATAPTLSGHDSDEVVVVKNTLKDNGTARGTWSEDTSGTTGHGLEKFIGMTGKKWLAAEGVSKAIADGKASFEALGDFYTKTKDTDAAELAQYKALFEAVVAEANAQYAAFKDGALVVAGNKAYTIDADTLAAAQKALDTAAKVSSSVTPTKTTYTDKVDAIITKVNTVLNAATESKVAPADIAAAKTVTEALKAAKTADEAKAAIEAYGKLTNDQKALVATADVQAAQEIISKAALVDAQDLAAARDLNGKKVTAKAKVGKKATGKAFKYKLAASESGATATYKKVSGSKYIKVSKSGKVTFKAVKVQKKAKTYSAKVSVTYGTQTVTKTVKLVVKKK